MATPEPLDLEERLEADPQGDFARELLGRLTRLRDGCAAARRRLNDPLTYRRLQAASQAVDMAADILEARYAARGTAR